MMTTGTINSVSPSKLVSCFKVVDYYDIKPNSYFIISKEGLHCELCHESGQLSKTTTIGDKTYEVCCAVEWAVDRITNPFYRS